MGYNRHCTVDNYVDKLEPHNLNFGGSQGCRHTIADIDDFVGNFAANRLDNLDKLAVKSEMLVKCF